MILVLYIGDEEPQKCPISLLEDMRNLGIMDRKSQDSCCINTLKREVLLEIATDRARWRKAVNTDGVCKALNQLYIAENTKAIKDIQSDGENFMPKTPFHSEAQTLGSRLRKAILRRAPSLLAVVMRDCARVEI